MFQLFWKMKLIVRVAGPWTFVLKTFLRIYCGKQRNENINQLCSVVPGKCIRQHWKHSCVWHFIFWLLYWQALTCVAYAADHSKQTHRSKWLQTLELFHYLLCHMDVSFKIYVLIRLYRWRPFSMFPQWTFAVCVSMD